MNPRKAVRYLAFHHPDNPVHQAIWGPLPPVERIEARLKFMEEIHESITCEHPDLADAVKVEVQLHRVRLGKQLALIKEAGTKGTAC